MNKMVKFVVVIPTYNEKGNIEGLCRVLFEEIFPKLDQQYDGHVLIVDDTSPDGTGELVKTLSKKYQNLHLFVNKKKMGLGNAYVKGIGHAVEILNADIVFQFDADFSHDPTRIPIMLKKIEDGADFVLGARYIKGGSIPSNWGWHRKFLSVVGNMVIRIVITHFAIHDWTTGYRAMKREVAVAILPEMNRETFMGYTFQIGFLHKTVRKGYEVAEVPINFVDRTYGKSKLGTEYIKNTLIYIFRARVREILNNRIVKFLLVGGVGTIVQLISLSIYRWVIPYLFSMALSIETAIISNFILNNKFTFADKPVEKNHIFRQLLVFNLASFGSVIIQMITATTGQEIFGLKPMWFIFMQTDTGFVYALIGIVLGMLWNYLAYTRIVWKVQPPRQFE